MIKCLHCQNGTEQVKAGRTCPGSQRYKCKPCNRRYTPEPKQQGYPDELRQQAVKLYVDGMNYRRIARQLRVDHKFAINWVNAHAARQVAALVSADVNHAETDELYTFIGSKKQHLPDDNSG